jgi:hypothetical protein
MRRPCAGTAFGDTHSCVDGLVALPVFLRTTSLSESQRTSTTATDTPDTVMAGDLGKGVVIAGGIITDRKWSECNGFSY